MSGFKRLCMFVFGLAGMACLAILVLPWYGIYQHGIATVLAHPIGGTVALVLACITGLGLLVCLLGALFTPRNPHSVIVSVVDGDEVHVTRDAIRAQAVHTIERDGTLTARSVNVKAKKRGHVRVFCRIQPNNTVNVAEVGAELHDRLMVGLSEICGDTVDSVTIEFVDPITHDEPVNFDSLEASYANMMPKAHPVSTEPESQSTTSETPFAEDIRVPMGHATTLRPPQLEPEITDDDNLSVDMDITEEVPTTDREDS